MTTETIRPNGDSTITWTDVPDPPSTHFDDVDEAVTDEDTSYVHTSGISQSDLFDLGNPTSIGGSDIINSVIVYFRARRTTPNLTKARIRIKTYATIYQGTVYNLVDAYANYSDVWTTNPNTGSPWTLTELNALIAGVFSANDGNDKRCTQVYVVVDFTSAAVPERNLCCGGGP